MMAVASVGEPETGVTAAMDGDGTATSMILSARRERSSKGTVSAVDARMSFCIGGQTLKEKLT